MPMWTLEKGINVVRALQPHTRSFNYHLTVGGGTVNKGESDKDLDLYFLPMGNNRTKPNPDGMLKFLEKLWGASEPLLHDYGDGVMEHYAHAVKFVRTTGQRIDCFIFKG